MVCRRLLKTFLIERLHARLRYTHDALILVGRKLHEEVVDGVHAQVVVTHFVVEVWCERETRVTRQRNHIATLHFLPASD